MTSCFLYYSWDRLLELWSLFVFLPVRTPHQKRESERRQPHKKSAFLLGGEAGPFYMGHVNLRANLVRSGGGRFIVVAFYLTHAPPGTSFSKQTNKSQT